ncbi:MAG: hypothetical protein K6F86_02725 [Lachnospiraceae bacterium]|nr:hypothetical protein [Lachnospiraceae bacterium]
MYITMKKMLRILLIAVICAVCFSGCGKKEDVPEQTVKEEVTEEKTEETEEEKKEEAETKVEEDKEKESGPEEFDPAKLAFRDRFLAGNRNIYFIDDDESTNQVLRCTEDDERIVYAGGDEKYYYVLLNDGKMNYTLYYWVEGEEYGSTELEIDKDISVYHMGVYEDCFYYDYYDGKNDEYPIWKYDPKKGETERDRNMERMKKYIDSYKGKNLTGIDYMSFIPGDLRDTGHMFGRNADDGTVTVFDSDGNESGSFKQQSENGTWSLMNDTYIFQVNEDYAGNGRSGDVSCISYNIKTGKSHIIWKGKNDKEELVPVDIKDGYFYYYMEEKSPDGGVASRKYYREKEEELENDSLNGQLLIDIPEWSGVIPGYIHEDGSVPDGFCVRGRRAYYLWFDDEAESPHHGDISWRALDMERTGFDDDTVITDAVERHETFADFGYIETDKEAETEKDFRYFTSTRDRFYFHDSIKNAAKMNEFLQQKYDENTGYAKDTKETAHNDIFGEEEVYDLDDPDAWAPSYSYDVNLSGLEKIGSHYIEVSFGDYVYYGGAHGMPGVTNYLFDTDTGDTVTIKDLFPGSENEFKNIVVQYSMDDWKNSGEYKYYESYDPSLEPEKKKEFEELAGFNMIIDFAQDGINVGYSPYAVGPFSSGFIEVFIPYDALNIKME